MRAGIGLVIVLATAAAGCQSLGFQEQSTRDFSTWTEKPGKYLDLGDPHKVKLVKFDTDFKAVPPKVTLQIQNDGPAEDFLSFEVEFGFPAPLGAIAPYDPDFVAVDFAELLSGKASDVRTVYATKAGVPQFARIVTTKGADVRVSASRETSDKGLREGTQLLGGRVTVVKVEGNLIPPEGQKPTLTYTIESMDEKTEVGNLRYLVQFYKDGKLVDMGRRFSTFRAVGKPLGKKGDRLTIEVAGLENVTGSLAGAKPVLRVIQ
jgi:hypothetical protein